MLERDMDTRHSTGHSKHLRQILRAARLEQSLSAQQVADRMAAALGKEKLAGQSILYYEAFERHPPVDVFAAWARSLGYRLVVDLDRADNQRFPVMVRHTEVADIARALDEAPTDLRAAFAIVVEKAMG